jgi:hypothetical protein
MGKINTITKDYMSEPKYFADSFNYYLFDGRQVIQSETLQVLDPTEMALIPKGTTVENVEKIRDVLKQCVLMADEKATYLMLGIENQTDVHYALPVKNMIYDALNYGKQVSDKAKEHREKKDLQDSGEFLSGFSKDDKLKPLITLTVYFGPKEWDAPRSLKEMFKTTDETILQFVEDYRVHLIVPKEIKDFNKFATEFGKAMRFIAASQDQDALDKLQKAEEFQSVDIQTVQLLNACTNSKIPIVEGEEEVNMCKGLDDIMARHRRKGKEEGQANLISTALQGGSTPEEIARILHIPIEEVKSIAIQ